MAFMDWQESYTVRVSEIDKQHKNLAGMINALHDSIRAGQDEASKGMLNPMIDAAQDHFLTEEKYMERFDYPETEAHKKEHEEFTREMLEVKKGVHAGELIVTLEIANFLKDWIEKHLKETDSRYVDCFVANGLR